MANKAPEPPRIENLRGKAATLERRIDYLKRRLADDTYASTRSGDFDKNELGALLAAVEALDYVSAVRA